ncbi:hypothetical protein C8R42DRAFT_77721 [Lentinula raphanica]|nr:hypothetical protein C8R42DRAFT_77721 [Lentinula raphanica]
MRYFSLSTAASVITNPCLFSLMGVFLLTIGNGTAVGAMDHDRQLVPNENQPNERTHPRPTLVRQLVLPLWQYIDIYISDLDPRLSIPTPQSVIILGNNPDDFARSGRMLRRRDPDNEHQERRPVISAMLQIETNTPLADDDPLINDPQPTRLLRIGSLRQFTSVDDLHTMLFNLLGKALPSNRLYCSAVLAHFFEDLYIHGEEPWLQWYHVYYISPQMDVLSIDATNGDRYLTPPLRHNLHDQQVPSRHTGHTAP